MTTVPLIAHSLMRCALALVLCTAAFGIRGAGIAAQTPDELAAACAAAGGSVVACGTGAAAGAALMSTTGRLSGAGSEIPGTASNLGTRVGGGPRLAAFVRFGATDVGLPELSADAGGGETKFGASALHIGAALALFSGFRIMPTVGGFLSTDVFANAAFVFLPSGQGFDGGTTSFTGGVRVGLIREGFTVPGISVSASRRLVGASSFGNGSGAVPASVDFDPAVTSIRAVIGKDLFAVELMAGWGWDRYSGDVTLRVPDIGGTAAVTQSGAMTVDRQLYFGGASMTFGIVLNVSIEAGWSGGLDPIEAYDGVWDPTSGGPFGAFSLRLTL